MRLVIATPLYPPELGGPATYTRLLEDCLPGQGIKVSVCKFSAVLKYPKGIRHLVYLWHVYCTLRRADAVLALDPVSVGFPALLASWCARKPYAVKIVGDYAWEQGRQRFGVTESLDDFVLRKVYKLPIRILQGVQCFVASQAKLVIVPSDYLKRIVRTWGIPEERIQVIPNAVAEEALTELSAEISELPRPLIVSIGRLVPWKGFEDLISAVKRVREITPASLVIAGEGPLDLELRTKAQIELSNDYLFTGAISHAEAFALLKAADIFVLNSTYEGMAHTLVEALISGVPVVTTDIEANRDVVKDAGVIVSAGDVEALAQALAGILANEEQKRELAEQARIRGGDFSLVRMASLTAGALKSIV